VREDARVSAIARIEAWPVNVPLEATYLMAPGVYPGMSRTVVRVTTSSNLRTRFRKRRGVPFCNEL